jgi:hypothetical protein
MTITSLRPGTEADLRWKVSAPSATRTLDLLLRRHSGASAVQISDDARLQRAKQLKAVAVRAILLGPREYRHLPAVELVEPHCDCCAHGRFRNLK